MIYSKKPLVSFLIPVRIILTLSIIVFFFNNGFSKSLNLKTIEFTQDHADTCKEIAKTLEKQHYTGKDIDDALSSKILDLFIKRLDPTRQLFYTEDLTRFKANEYKLDDYIKKGDLTFAADVINLYLERSEERFLFILDLIDGWETKFDFTEDDSLVIDAENKPWETSKGSLETLWKKYLKNHILTFILDDKPPAEITDELKKIYTSRLNRLYQTDLQDAFEIYINSVTSSFDPHTQFFPPRASEDFDIHMSLSLEGIGAVLQNEYEFTKVVRIIPAGPADKSKLLMPGDKIVGVGQGDVGEIIDILGQRIENVVKLIRGPKDSFVRLKIIPVKDATALKTIRIKRDTVKLEEQSAQKKIVTLTRDGISYNIGIIEIPTFYLDFNAYNSGQENYKSTTKDVERLIEELKKENIDGLIVDLRDNGGGALQEASLLTGLFLKTGPTVQIKAKYRVQQLYDDDPAIAYNGPLMVLINRMSASASEIFAGAIKDYNRGIIVGTQSFGKGTVQSLQPLNKGKLKLTNAKFYRVSGESTQELGVMPDISYPPVYQTDKIGESSLDGALPWDKTRKSKYKAYGSLQEPVSILKTFIESNTNDSAGLAYLRKKIELGHEASDTREVSLNEEKRKMDRISFKEKQLGIENEYRKTIGKPAIKDLSEIEDPDSSSDDILLTETQNLMTEFIRYSKNNNLAW